MASMIGNSQLDMEVLKEPRGFIRCLQWFFAMLAFATCCDFSTKIAFDIECKNQDTLPIHVSFKVNYPFRYLNYSETCMFESFVLRLFNLNLFFTSDWIKFNLLNYQQLLVELIFLTNPMSEILI